MQILITGSGGLLSPYLESCAKKYGDVITSSRNTGNYHCDLSNLNKVKELIIAPGQSLSMQRHQYRAEHWYILKGECLFNTINVSSDVEELGTYKENQTIRIKNSQWHQACNTTNEPCHILFV